MLVTGLISLLLFLRERSRRLYLWLAIYLITLGSGGLNDALQSNEISFTANQLYNQIFSCVAWLSLWALLLALFGMDRERSWRRWTAALAGLSLPYIR